MTDRLEGSSVDAVRLGRAIAAARAEQGIKRAQLAVAADVSYPYLSELENGTKHGSTRKIAQIAGALGLSSSQLLARAEALGVDEPVVSSTTSGGPAGTGDGAGRTVSRSEEDTSAAGVSLRPLSRRADRTEELVVERITRAVRAEIERWLDSELELAVREHVREVLGDPEVTR